MTMAVVLLGRNQADRHDIGRDAFLPHQLRTEAFTNSPTDLRCRRLGHLAEPQAKARDVDARLRADSSNTGPPLHLRLRPRRPAGRDPLCQDPRPGLRPLPLVAADQSPAPIELQRTLAVVDRRVGAIWTTPAWEPLRETQAQRMSSSDQ